MFKHYPSVILRDDVLEGFVGKVCIGTKDVIGCGLGKCSVNYNVGLAGFVMEKLSHRKDQNANEVFGRINMVEYQDNRA